MSGDFWGGYFIGRGDARVSRQMHDVAFGLAQRLFGGYRPDTVGEMAAEIERLRDLLFEVTEAGLAVEESNRQLRQQIKDLDDRLRMYRFLAGRKDLL